MSSIERLLRANRTIMQVPLYEKADGSLVIVSPTGTTTPFATPSASVLDAWRQVITTGVTGSSHGGNVSCAILDSVNLSIDTSETDDELTICSIGNEQSPLFDNITLEIVGFRDKNKSDTGVFNLYTWLNVGVDIRYAWVDRISVSPTTAFAAGQVISMYGALTDVPVDVREDRGNLKLAQTPQPTGDLLHLYTLASEAGVAPSITSQPSDASALVGEAAVFTSTASGTPTPTVQWQVSSNSGATWSNLSGATSTTLTTDVLGSGDNGLQFRAVFTNSEGSATSSAATLTVTAPAAPTITGQPSSIYVRAVDNPVQFTASATDYTSVKWQSASESTGPWTDISGATSATYSGTAALADAGKFYRAVFTGTGGSTSTQAAQLVRVENVTDANPVGYADDHPRGVVVGGTATFRAGAVKNGSTLYDGQWRTRVGTSGSWVDLPGETGQFYTTPAVVATDVSPSQPGNDRRYQFVRNGGTTVATPFNGVVLRTATTAAAPSFTLSAGLGNYDDDSTFSVQVNSYLSIPSYTSLLVEAYQGSGPYVTCLNPQFIGTLATGISATAPFALVVGDLFVRVTVSNGVGSPTVRTVTTPIEPY